MRGENEEDVEEGEEEDLEMHSKLKKFPQIQCKILP